MSSNRPSWLKKGRTIWLYGKPFAIHDVSNPKHTLIESEEGQISGHDLIALKMAGCVTLVDPVHSPENTDQFDDASDQQIMRAHEIANDLSKVDATWGKKTLALIKMAEKYGVSLRQVQRWLKSLSLNGLSGLLSNIKNRGGPGKRRLKSDTETEISNGIEEHLLCDTPKSIDETIRLIRSKCAYLNIKVPSPNAIRARINEIPKKQIIKAQKGT